MEKLAKYSTIIYALIWFLGFILSYSYYSVFNIDIVEYLDFTEVFFGFFTKILDFEHITRVALFMLNYSLIFIGVYELAKRAHNFIYLMLFVETLVLILIGVFRLITYVFDIDTTNFPFKMNYVVIILLLFFTLKLFGLYKLKIRGAIGYFFDKFYTLTLGKISWIIFILLMSYSFTVYTLYRGQESKALQLKGHDMRIKDVSFNYSDVFVQTDSIVAYLGGTKNNLFLYNRQTSETLVFEKDNITNLKFRKAEK